MLFVPQLYELGNMVCQILTSRNTSISNLLSIDISSIYLGFIFCSKSKKGMSLAQRSNMRMAVVKSGQGELNC